MPKTLRKALQFTLLAALLAGCGSTSSEGGVAGSSPGVISSGLDDRTLANQFLINHPNLAGHILSVEHLDYPVVTPPPPPSGPTNSTLVLPVADLETAYEVLFMSLNQKLNVTPATPECVSDVTFIKRQPETGFFDLDKKPILNNPLGVTGVSFQALEYDTTVPLPTGNQTFHVSGGLLMPLGITKSQVKGIVVYFHGTTFNKSQVGSEYAGNVETQLNAQIFASQGYIVAIPDYVGQGIDWQDVHPYVIYPQVSAQTAVDMLSAVKSTITNQYGFSSGDPALKLFSAGYSEGGSYSLWFNTYLSTHPGLLDTFYRLTHSVGMEGAYSTSRITYAYLFEDVSAGDGNPFNIQNQVLTNIVKPLLSADAFLSYATYSVASNFASVFNIDFFNMKASVGVSQSDCNVDGQQVTVASAFARPNTTISSQLLYSGLNKSANGERYPGQIELLVSSKNTIKSLVDKDLLSASSQAQLLKALQEADADLSAVADDGVSIITLQQDSVVVPNNFDELLAKFPTKIKTAIKVDQNQLFVLAGVSDEIGRAIWIPPDHLHGPIYEYLYALHIFNGF